MKAKIVLLFLVVAVFALIITGCGNSGGSTTSTTDTPTNDSTPSSGTTPTTITTTPTPTTLPPSSSTTGTAAPIDLASSLSGTWTGTVTVTQAGPCTWDDVNPAPVSMNWIVDASGAITAHQTQPMDLIWNGTVTPGLNVTLSFNRDVLCGTSSTPLSVTYTGPIVQSGSHYSLSMTQTETWCTSCIFTMAYSLTK